jgi:autophagy-related protein 11
MSLQIAVAHTGQRLDADPVAFSSVDALKHWVSRATEIAPESQILLTPGGKHVKLQALLTEVRGTCLDNRVTANVLLL